MSEDIGPVDEIPHGSALDMLMHMSAQVLALSKLAISYGICTEDDFNREFVKARQLLEESQVAAQQEQRQLAKQRATEHQISVGAIAHKLLKERDPDADVKVLCHQDSQGEITLFVRLVSTIFADRSDDERREITKPIVDYLNEDGATPVTRFAMIAISPDELTSNPAAVQFEELYQDHLSKKVKA